MISYQLLKTSFGYTICLRKDDCITQEIVKNGVYQPFEIIAIKTLLSSIDEPICLEVGANVGTHGLAMAPLSKTVYMFEPQPDNVELINKSLSINHYDNCQVLSIALSDHSGKGTLFVNAEGNNGGSTADECFFKEYNYKTSKIPVVFEKGDNILKKLDVAYVSLIKIDVEGFESRVLKGLEATIQLHQPFIFIEWYHEYTKNMFKEQDIFNTILKSYKALSVQNDLSLYHKKTKGQLLRFFKRFIYKLLHPNRYLVLGQFEFSNNYSLILLCPNVRYERVEKLFEKKSIRSLHYRN